MPERARAEMTSKTRKKCVQCPRPQARATNARSKSAHGELSAGQECCPPRQERGAAADQPQETLLRHRDRLSKKEGAGPPEQLVLLHRASWEPRCRRAAPSLHLGSLY